MSSDMSSDISRNDPSDGPQPPCDLRDAIFPPPLPLREDADESGSVWGFRDSRFLVNTDGNVEFSGARYAIAGQELSELLPWMARTLSVDLDPADRFEAAPTRPARPSRATPELCGALAAALSEERVVLADERRQRCGHGHTQDEVFALRTGGLDYIPDVVVEPVSRSEIAAVLRVASATGSCVVPYGGGTNVTLALRPPAAEERTIIALDLRRMNRIRWIDPRNRLACIEAGAVGRQLAASLAGYGLTLGHEPDSIEFSTLGGWIATGASGMKKNRYGNIEDIVLDVEAVTPGGVLRRSGAAPRESVGTDPADWLFGSEGSLGVAA
jgi:alkyldihydroxyacetonephosphate synthase